MTSYTLAPFDSSWDSLISTLPSPHILQTYEWAQVKAQVGWKSYPMVWRAPNGDLSAAALILERTFRIRGLSTGLKVLYVPKGPLLDWTQTDLAHQVIADLQSFARHRGAIFIKIDPDICLGAGIPNSDSDQPDPLGARYQSTLSDLGWRFSGEQIQFRNTVCIDLRPDEAGMLERMKQKTRYNIRLAEKKGVSIRPGSLNDLPRLYHMYAETAVRDGFVIRDQHYYTFVWQTFMNAGLAQPLIAEVEGEAVAAVFLFHLGQRGWYIYGMSRQAHREKMPNYLLQWEAMRWLKARGCEVYDLWGAPDEFNESDSMWGVFRFKEGLGGQVVRTLGAWDYPVHLFIYRMYTQTLPRLLDVMRRRGKERTQQEVVSV